MTSDFVVMTCACPRPLAGGSVIPRKSVSVVVTGVKPPFGIHHDLSPVLRSYAVMPPICFGFTIGTPAIVEPPARPSKPPPPRPRPAPTSGRSYPGGGGSAPRRPQLSRGEL